jgi:hypothetical protein
MEPFRCAFGGLLVTVKYEETIAVSIYIQRWGGSPHLIMLREVSTTASKRVRYYRWQVSRLARGSPLGLHQALGRLSASDKKR